MHLWLIGMMGSGKSTVGERVAKMLGMPFVDLDRVIEGRTGARVAEIFRERGEPAFRALESEAVDAVSRGPASVIATGGGAVTRPANVARMSETGRVMWLDAAVEVLSGRLAAEREERPLLAEADGGLERLGEIAAQRHAAYASASHRRIDAAAPVDTVVARVVDEWRAGAPVAVPGIPYPVYVGRGTLGAVGGLVRAALPRSLRAVIVTDARIEKTHARRVAKSLTKAGIRNDVVRVPGGEKSKNLATVEKIWDRLLSLGVDRDTVVVAIGGGVVGDLAGFAASTTLRGLPLVHVPTTLVAQVDSAIGAKCGFDTKQGKNLVGAFHEPALVVADVETLLTLPEREVRAGLAEVVKYGAIADEPLFDRLERRRREPFLSDLNAVEVVVRRCAELKMQIVARDPRERGERVLLNFGHTVGHALETAAGFRGLLHGEAVAAGMVAEAELSAARGECAAHDVERLGGLLHDLGLPLDAELGRAARYLSYDKKRHGDLLRLPVLRAIGRAVPAEIPISVVRSFLLGDSRTIVER